MQRPGELTFTLFAVIIAASLLLIFILVNRQAEINERESDKSPREFASPEHLTDTAGFIHSLLASHNFTGGDPSDPANHLSDKGFPDKNSLVLSAGNAFSPGIGISFTDLKPGAEAWLRVSGWVWFDGEDHKPLCSLVTTCNQQGINYKYVSLKLENLQLLPGRWNRVSADYRIPDAADMSDLVQAYFWYRGTGTLLVDNIRVEYFNKP